MREGAYRGHGYSIFRGSFRTPCYGRVYDALPQESRVAQALWIRPDGPMTVGAAAAAAGGGGGAEQACVVHMAATGDHGFTRRMHIGLPLVEQVCVVHTCEAVLWKGFLLCPAVPFGSSAGS